MQVDYHDRESAKICQCGASVWAEGSGVLEVRHRVSSVGLMEEGLGFKTSALVQGSGSGFRSQGSGPSLRVQGSGFVQSSGVTIQSSGFRVQDSDLRSEGSGSGIEGSGHRRSSRYAG
eukprot:2575826-Rhodomonas_salina.1